MKRTIPLVAVLLTLLVTPTLFIGCGCGATTEARQTTSFKTLKSVQIATDAAMRVYGEAVVRGKVSVEKQALVDAKHAQFRAAFRTAVGAARNDLTAIPPGELQALVSDLQILISDIP